MKTPVHFSWLYSWTLLVFLAASPAAFGATNGVIVIATRAPQDTAFGSEFVSDEKGPGMVAPGDVAMGTLLSDHGYTFRLLLDRLLGPAAATIGQDPANFLNPVNTNFAPRLIIMSGSSSSADTPPPPPGVPLMMGEHVCLGNNAARQGSIYLYKGTASNDPNESGQATKYMKVIGLNHPIMQGIPLDSQGRVKIWREPYPEEESQVPATGKRNFEYRWCAQAVADAAPGTTVLGVLDGANDRAVFAVADIGGLNANDQVNSNRFVHMFLNENGSGGSRRVFHALTETGRLLFLRAAKWAMGETLPPYQPIRIIEVIPAGAQAVKLSWPASARENYKIQASTDFTSWQTVVEDVRGRDGFVSSTLDIKAGPQTAFLRVGRVP